MLNYYFKGKFTMKKLLGITLLLFTSLAHSANTYQVILPNPPGSATDMVFRIIEKEYQARTGDTLVPIYAPGADHIIAGQRFKNSANNTILLGTTSLHVYSPTLKDSVPYSDQDFQHIAWIGDQPSVYAVKGNSPYTNLKDSLIQLGKSKKPFIGTPAPSAGINLDILKKYNKLSTNVDPILYKGGPACELALQSDDVDMLVYAVTASTIGLQQAGKLRIIGSTLPYEIELGGVKIPSAMKELKVPQLNGGFLLSLKPDADAEFVRQFSTNINAILAMPKVQEELIKLTVYSTDIRGDHNVRTAILNMRKLVKDTINK
jgi:tripartite-type tricarboxylate transporter receptor subunit TctC